MIALAALDVPVSGMGIPRLGTKAANPPPAVAPIVLADVLFTLLQQRVLGPLFGQPERRYQSAELIRLAGSGTGSVHRQLTQVREFAFNGRRGFQLQGISLHPEADTGRRRQWLQGQCSAWLFLLRALGLSHLVRQLLE